MWKLNKDPLADLRELIEDFELPSFSAVAVSTLTLLREEGDMAQIAERIMADPGLSVRMLRTVNSAAFGMRQSVSNLQHAVSLLGRSRVESLVLSAAISDALPPPTAIDGRAFWHTSAKRACLAKGIATQVDPTHSVESFTAGLLQDMAVPVLVAKHPDRYPALFAEATANPIRTLEELERDAFGYDHAQVGAAMASSWALPETLVTAIGAHHVDGQGAPRAVEAVARVRHGAADEELLALRGHCRDVLAISDLALGNIIQSATEECSSLAESMAA